MLAISPAELRRILDKLEITLADLPTFAAFTPSLPAAGAAPGCRTGRLQF